MQPPPLAVGDLVWYLRPPDSGDKLATKWIGPTMVTAREGDSSYEIEVKPGFFMKAHRGALKLYTPEKFSVELIHLFFHRRTSEDLEGALGEYILEKVLGHEVKGGNIFFPG